MRDGAAGPSRRREVESSSSWRHLSRPAGGVKPGEVTRTPGLHVRHPLFPPAVPVHQAKDAFADLEQLGSRLGGHFGRQNHSGLGGVKAGQRLMQMAEGTLEAGTGECVVTRVPPLGDIV
jgi:hypothetical protein